MGLRLTAVWWALVATSATSMNPAWAQPDDAATEDGADEARALFERAAAHAERGAWKDACPLFQRAHDLGPTGGTRLRLADCYENLGDLDRARRYYQEIVDNQATETKPERLVIARERLATLPPPVEEPVPKPEPEPVSAPPPPSTAIREDPGFSPVPGAILASIGGAGLVVGAVLGGLALAEESDIRAACPTGTCAPDLATDADAAEGKALGADIALIAGGAIAATGVVLLVVSILDDDTPLEARQGGVAFRF